MIVDHHVHLLEDPLHAGLNRWVEDLNKAYRDIPAFHELDMSPEGFEWIDCCDTESSIVSLMRRSKTAPDAPVVVGNRDPAPLHVTLQVGAVSETVAAATDAVERYSEEARSLRRWGALAPRAARARPPPAARRGSSAAPAGAPGARL